MCLKASLPDRYLRFRLLQVSFKKHLTPSCFGITYSFSQIWILFAQNSSFQTLLYNKITWRVHGNVDSQEFLIQKLQGGNKFEFLASSQVVLMKLVQAPYMENIWIKIENTCCIKYIQYDTRHSLHRASSDLKYIPWLAT